MGAIGGIIDSAVGAATGTSGGTTLQDFLHTFSSSEGIWAKTIDPFSSFDVSIKFFPSDWNSKKDDNKDWLDKVGESLMSSAKNSVKSLANNATGGLLGSIMNSDVDIMIKHDGNTDALNGKKTFMEYLAAANLIVGKEDWVGEEAG